jgi:hypothetical protein
MCQESQFWEFWDSQLGNFGTTWHLNATPMINNKEYYKGEGGGFPQVRAVVNLVSSCMFVVSLMNLCMHVARPCTKSAPTMH